MELRKLSLAVPNVGADSSDAAGLAGLTEKRAEISRQIAETRAALRQLFTDLDHIDAAIRLFERTYKAEAAARAQATNVAAHTTYRGELERTVLNLLREAPDPLTTKEVALHIMSERGKNVSNNAMVKMMTRRAGVLLSRYRERGAVRSIQNHRSGKPELWEIAV
jgi:hypothetical protein